MQISATSPALRYNCYLQVSFPDNCEVCVVGGGPAGLSASIALSKAGCRPAVVDCATPPIDKACGEGLLPDSLDALETLGIKVPIQSACKFRGIRFIDPRSSVTADFPLSGGVGIRRTVLHSLLVSRAEQLGIPLFWGVKDVRLAGGGVSVNGSLLKSPFVVAADGQQSPLRHQAALDGAEHYSQRYGFRRHYRLSPWSPYMELHWGKKCQIYITPVSADETAVALISRDPKLRLDRALEEFPDVRSRLKGAVPTSSERGALSVSRRLRRVSTNGLALIGDASGSVDALTGEGLGLSFRQALALADALQKGSLKEYEVQHRKLSRRPRMMAALLLLLDKYPAIQTRALASLAARPAVFESLLAVHVGENAFHQLCSWKMLDFCRAFLTA